ncbi:MAG: PadR family transcriptional regulator [Bryobacteraceae bacterium]
MDRKTTASNDLLPGTLDLLILKTLTRGPLHGYGIAQYLLQTSGQVLQVGEGSLYPALQRLLVNGWADAEWGQSETGRRARFYKLTAGGRRRLRDEEREFDRMVDAIRVVLRTV